MKKKMVSVLCLMMVVSTGIARFAHATQSSGSQKAIPQASRMSEPQRDGQKRPMIDPAKVKEAREACMKVAPLPVVKKGEKPDVKKMEKFRNCMHEKLASEVNRVRQQRNTK